MSVCRSTRKGSARTRNTCTAANATQPNGVKMEAIKVLIVDDHSLVRDGLSRLLEEQDNITVVGQAGDGLEAVEAARELQPDIVLMDLRMPGMDGVEVMRRIRSENPHHKFIVLTAYDSDESILEAIEAGAMSYVLKDSPREELFHALRWVQNGKSIIDPSLTTRVLGRLTLLSHHAASNDVLSKREVEVLRVMATGATNQEIGDSLFITQGTARTHVANILRKLNVKDRTEAVAKSMQKGIIRL